VIEERGGEVEVSEWVVDEVVRGVLYREVIEERGGEVEVSEWVVDEVVRGVSIGASSRI